MADKTSGHRSVPHTTICGSKRGRPPATAPPPGRTRHHDELLDTSRSSEPHPRAPATDDRDDDLLVAVLDEVIYLLDATGEAPVDVDVDGADRGIDVTFAMADATTLPQIGAVPKAVSLNELRFSHGQKGWRCAVTLDV